MIKTNLKLKKFQNVQPMKMMLKRTTNLITSVTSTTITGDVLLRKTQENNVNLYTAGPLCAILMASAGGQNACFSIKIKALEEMIF